jgi:hypothetical protein
MLVIRALPHPGQPLVNLSGRLDSGQWWIFNDSNGFTDGLF